MYLPILLNVQQHSYAKLCHIKMQRAVYTVPTHLDDNKAIVLTFLTNQIKLT